MHTTSSQVTGKRLFAKVIRVFRSGIISPWGRRHIAVLVGDRYLEGLRVKARVLDRHGALGASLDDLGRLAAVLLVLEFLVLFSEVM